MKSKPFTESSLIMATRLISWNALCKWPSLPMQWRIIMKTPLTLPSMPWWGFHGSVTPAHSSQEKYGSNSKKFCRSRSQSCLHYHQSFLWRPHGCFAYKLHLIYEFMCHCGRMYVGKTSQCLVKRIKQHVPDKLLPTTPETVKKKELIRPSLGIWRSIENAWTLGSAVSLGCWSKLDTNSYSTFWRRFHSHQVHGFVPTKRTCPYTVINLTSTCFGLVLI